ncbi:MAG: hypothetical protein HWE27_03410 [Gammaproteobacteria bacterium]|nr:hypothetical protein [Gammaproteobacteria bacterium]
MKKSSHTAYLMLIAAFMTVISQCCVAMTPSVSNAITQSVSSAENLANTHEMGSDFEQESHFKHGEHSEHNMSHAQHACCDPNSAGSGEEFEVSHYCDGCEHEALYSAQLELSKTFFPLPPAQVSTVFLNGNSCAGRPSVEHSPPNRGSPLFIQFCSFLI